MVGTSRDSVSTRESVLSLSMEVWSESDDNDEDDELSEVEDPIARVFARDRLFEDSSMR